MRIIIQLELDSVVCMKDSYSAIYENSVNIE